MSTNMNDPHDALGAAGNEPLRDPQATGQERQPRETDVDHEHALDAPDDPREVDPGDVDEDPSRVGGDPAEDDA